MQQINTLDQKILELKGKFAELGIKPRGRRDASVKGTEEVRQPTSAKDIPVQAGSLNLGPSRAEEVKQAPSMVAAPSDNDGFHTCRGGDTLDSFGPLTHRGQKPLTADQPAQWT